MITLTEIETAVKNIYYIGVIVFVLQWCALLWIISRTTGWSKLAKAYPQTYPPREKRDYFGSLKMSGLGSYNNCVIYGADQQGLHLSLWPIFRISHPPLFLPWEQMLFQEDTFNKRPAIKITSTQEPGVPMIIPDKMKTRIENQSGRKLIYV